MRFVKYTKDILQAAVDVSFSLSDVLRFLGLKLTGSHHRHIRQRINKFEISIDHFKIISGQTKYKNKKLLPEDILVNNRSPKGNREITIRLRRAMIESGFKEICSECGMSCMWNGKFLRLQIDHINGDGTDNTKENLRFLCPNCHSQTENYGVKKIKKKHKQYKVKKDDEKPKRICKRPAREILEILIAEKPATHIAKDFGVSDKSVEKWCKFYDLDKPGRGYWAKKYAKMPAECGGSTEAYEASRNGS